MSFTRGTNPGIGSILSQLQAQEGLREAVANHQQAQRQQQAQRAAAEMNPLHSLLSSGANPSLAAAYAGLMNEQLSRQQEMNQAAAAAQLNQGLGLGQASAEEALQAAALRRYHLAAGGGGGGGPLSFAGGGQGAQHNGLLELQLQLQRQQQLQSLRGFADAYNEDPRQPAMPQPSAVAAEVGSRMMEGQRSPPPPQGAASPAKGRESTSSPVRGTVLVPCRARGMPMDHNFKTAHFIVPEDIEHGADLICSYNACRNAGIKFRFCTYCQVPVAKRNFRKRHMHGMDTLGDDDDKDDDSEDASTQASRTSMSPVSASIPMVSERDESTANTKVRSSFSSVSTEANRVGANDAVEEARREAMAKAAAAPSPARRPVNARPEPKDEEVKEKKRKKGRKKKEDPAPYIPPAPAPAPEAARTISAPAVKAEEPVFEREEAPRRPKQQQEEKKPAKEETIKEETPAEKEEAARMRRWDALLHERPSTDDNDAMSQWLIQVLAVSDRSKPFAADGSDTEEIGSAAGPPDSSGAMGAPPKSSDMKTEGGRSQSAPPPPKHGGDGGYSSFGGRREERSSSSSGLERHRSNIHQHRGEDETAAAEAMAALPSMQSASSRDYHPQGSTGGKKRGAGYSGSKLPKKKRM